MTGISPVFTRSSKGVRWETLKEWERARGNCKRVLDKLREGNRAVVSNSLNQERATNLLQRVKKESREDDPVKRVAEVVLRQIWGATIGDKLDEEGPLFETVLRGKGIPQEINVKSRQEINVKSRDETIFTFFGDTNKSLAERVTHICNLVAHNLRKRDMVQQLHNEVHRMKKASDELHDMLNPVKLRPMILRTRCDLCPA
jgi:hypothetical protein